MTAIYNKYKGGSKHPYTTAVFEVEGRIYYGCAQFDRNEKLKPWYAWLTYEGEYYKTIGDCQTVEEAWAKARAYLGIVLDDDLPRKEGEPMDGGPFNSNDRTHVR